MNPIGRWTGFLFLNCAMILSHAPSKADTKSHDPLCRDYRMSVFNYLSDSWDTMEQISNESSVENALLYLAQDPGPEFCVWNRFFFLDFVLYFDSFTDIEIFKDKDETELRLSLMAIRDRHWSNWLRRNHEIATSSEPFFEWQDDLTEGNLAGMPLDQFLSKGADNFGFIETMADILMPSFSYPPGDEEGAAQLLNFKNLNPKTPFSSIMTRQAIDGSYRPDTRAGLECLKTKVSRWTCGDSLFNEAVACANGNTSLAMELLGVYSTQRMYLMRDVGAWLEANVRDETERRAIFKVFADGATIYFKGESIGLKCGVSDLYPMGWMPQATEQGEVAKKFYHFWSVAYLSYQLGRMGYSADDSYEASTQLAKKYKSYIRVLGIPANIINNGKTFGGTVGDYDAVRNAQDRGALFGWELAQDSVFEIDQLTFKQSLLPKQMMAGDRFRIRDWKFEMPGLEVSWMLEKRSARSQKQGVGSHARIYRKTLFEIPAKDFELIENKLKETRQARPRVVVDRDFKVKLIY